MPHNAPTDSARLSWDADADRWQDILNEQPVPPRRDQRRCHIPITARIVWERDGVQYLDTTAVGYTRALALVRIEDRRRRTLGVWLRPGDVTRR